MNYYSSNTVARYATKLLQVMELEGDWEVALAEITIPSPLPNVTRDTHFFTLRSTDTDETHEYTLRWGYYDTAVKVLMEMNSLISAHPTGVAFRYQMKRVKLINNGSYEVEFSDALAHMLGFSAGTRYQPRSLRSYCHSNYRLVVCHRSHVVRVLRHFGTRRCRRHYGSVASHRERGSHAVACRTPDNESTAVRARTEEKNFDTIEMNIMTDTGEPVPFMDGKTVVVLEFKRIGLL